MMLTSRPALGLTVLLLGLMLPQAHAEDGSAAWLRYAPVAQPAQYRAIPSSILALGESEVGRNAARELQVGLTQMLGRPFSVSTAQIRTAESSAGALVLTDSAKARNGKTLLPEEYEI